VYVRHPGYLGRSAAVELRMIDGELRMAGVDLLGRAASHARSSLTRTSPVSTELVRGVVLSSLVAASQDPRVRAHAKKRPPSPVEGPEEGRGQQPHDTPTNRSCLTRTGG
jgi:hypothetical protein